MQGFGEVFREILRMRTTVCDILCGILTMHSTCRVVVEEACQGFVECVVVHLQHI